MIIFRTHDIISWGIMHKVSIFLFVLLFWPELTYH